MIVSCSIHIDAPVDRVFDLMCDPGRRAALNPNVIPLLAETEDGLPIHHGSVCHFQLRIGERIADYRLNIREVVPMRRIVAISDTAIPFETIMEVAAEDGGTRLTQTETFVPTDDMLREAVPPVPASRRLSRLLERLYPVIDGDSATSLRDRQEAALRNSLERKLALWLDAIRKHLETPSVNR